FSAPHLALFFAEDLPPSALTAVVVTSVILSGLSSRITSPATRLQLAAVHHTVVFVLESVVFALIGLQLPGLFRGESPAWIFGTGLLLAAALLAMRVAWVFPLSAFQHWRHVGAPRPVWQGAAAGSSGAG